MRGIESPKTDYKLLVYMTLTDLQQLFGYLERDQSPFSMRNELMFKLLAKTGLRRSELVSLTWDQVDIINEMIRINGRTNIALHPHLIPLLASYKATLRSNRMYPKEPVFLKNHKASYPRGLHVIFKDVMKKQALHLPASRCIIYGIHLQN